MKSFALLALGVVVETAFLVSVALPSPDVIRATAQRERAARAMVVRAEAPSAPAAPDRARVQLAIR